MNMKNVFAASIVAGLIASSVAMAQEDSAAPAADQAAPAAEHHAMDKHSCQGMHMKKKHHHKKHKKAEKKAAEGAAE